MRNVGLLVAVLFATTCSTVSEEVTVLLHLHSNLSDGIWSPKQTVIAAKAAGASVVFLSDHAGSVKNVEEWAQAMRQAGSGLAMEVGIGPKGTGQAHLIYAGGPESDYVRVVQIDREVAQDDPEEALQQLRDLADGSGAVLIAAHPCHSLCPFPSEWLKYVNAVEVFDHGPSDGPADVLRMAAGHAEETNHALSIVAGSDFDGGPVTASSPITHQLLNGFWPDLWRFTMAETDRVDPDAVIECIREGRCSACFCGVEATRISSSRLKQIADGTEEADALVREVEDALLSESNKLKEAMAELKKTVKAALPGVSLPASTKIFFPIGFRDGYIVGCDVVGDQLSWLIKSTNPSSQQPDPPASTPSENGVVVLGQSGYVKVTVVSRSASSYNKLFAATPQGELRLLHNGDNDNVTTAPIDSFWRLGPYDAGATLGFYIYSGWAKQNCSPRIEGNSPCWRLRFEDKGGDADWNDLVLKVEEGQ